MFSMIARIHFINYTNGECMTFLHVLLPKILSLGSLMTPLHGWLLTIYDKKGRFLIKALKTSKNMYLIEVELLWAMPFCVKEWKKEIGYSIRGCVIRVFISFKTLSEVVLNVYHILKNMIIRADIVYRGRKKDHHFPHQPDFEPWRLLI